AEVTRLTEGPWTDTHCQWSPNGDCIVFSSTRDKPKEGVPQTDNDLDPGYFAVFLAKVPKAKDVPAVVVTVVASRIDLAGHVNL
ncbi:Six-bladed beta-propeller, partial [Parasponia andersonii]